MSERLPIIRQPIIRQPIIRQPIIRQPIIRQPIISCEGCGACCLSIGHPFFMKHTVDKERWRSMPAALRQSVDDHVASLTDIDHGSPCIWYDAQLRACRHYDYRPEMCRDFALDSSACHDARRWNGL